MKRKMTLGRWKRWKKILAGVLSVTEGLNFEAVPHLLLVLDGKGCPTFSHEFAGWRPNEMTQR
jgi:hypothetical protein